MLNQKYPGKSRLGGLFFALTLLAAAAPVVRADVLALYPFSNSSLASTATPPLSTASAITLGSGLTDPTRFTSTGTNAPALRVNTDETDGTSFATAITAGDFFTLNLAPASGYHFVFQSFSVDLATSATTFATNVRLQASLDGGNTFADLNNVSAYSSTTFTTETFDLTARNTAAVLAGASVVLRVVVFDNANDANNYTALDNITLNGTVQPIPEPGTVALLTLGVAVAGGAVWRRRQR